MKRSKSPFLRMLFFLVFVTANANAAVFQVTKTDDTNDGVCDSDCSLREAVIEANITEGLDTIELPAGIYNLNIIGIGEDNSETGDLDIAEDLIIIGEGRELSIINGLGKDRVFQVKQLGEFEPTISLTINNITIRNGFTAELYSTGAGVLFESNGTLSIENSMLTKNHSTFYGGALEVRSFSSSFLIPETILNVSNSIITDNCATSGVAIDGDGHWNITDSTISHNGGWFVPEQGQAFDCQVNEAGGGMYLNRVNATIRNTSIIGNKAIGGGGIYIYCCSIEITNTTIAQNSTYLYNGGGLENYGDLKIVNSTIVHNTSNGYAGGINSGQPVSVVNTIVANNVASVGPDCYGPVESLGNNLIGDTSDCGFAPDANNTDLYGLPELDVFVDDGAPGSGYYPLLSNSILIDAGNDVECPDDDQRGMLRPADGNGDNIANCDIGAYEVIPDVTPVIVAQIDVKPNDTTNIINLNAGGVVPIAILSTVDFNALDIDTSLNDDGSGKITFSGASAKIKGKSGSYTSTSDVDGDGDLDLVIHFHITEIDPVLFEIDGSIKYASISGVLYDESPFTGRDNITIVKE